MTTTPPVQDKSINISITNVPRVKFEILIWGYEDENKKPSAALTSAIDDLQRQINKCKRPHEVRAFYMVMSREHTPEDIMKKMVTETKSKFHAFVNIKEDEYMLPVNFVSDCLNQIRKLESAYEKFKELSINVTKNQ